MNGAARHDNPRPTQTIVLRDNRQVELADARVLDLDGHGMPAARPPDRQCRHCRVAAATDDELRPGRHQVESMMGRGKRKKPKSRWQVRPREADGQPFLDERKTDGLGKAERLADHTWFSVVKDPGERQTAIRRCAYGRTHCHRNRRHSSRLREQPEDRNEMEARRKKIARRTGSSCDRVARREGSGCGESDLTVSIAAFCETCSPTGE